MKTKSVLILVAVLAVFAGNVGPAHGAAVEVWGLIQEGPAGQPTEIHRFNPNTLAYTGTINIPVGEFAWHLAVAKVGMNGTVWATGYKRPKIIGVDGTILGEVDDAGFSFTEGIEKRNGKMLVMGNSPGGPQIVEYNLDGTISQTVVGPGGDLSAANEGMGVGPDGKIYAVQTGDDQVRRFSKSGALELIGPAQGGEMSDIAVITQGALAGTGLVTDRQGNEIRQLDLTTLAFGPAFASPSGAAQVIMEPVSPFNILSASTGSGVRSRSRLL